MKKITLPILLLTVFFAASAGAADPNLVAHWKFDDGAGDIAVDSAGGNNGTVVGATGTIDGALNFDGTGDYVELPDNEPIWLPLNDFTVSFWVYFDSDASGTHENIIDLNCGVSSGSNSRLGVR